MTILDQVRIDLAGDYVRNLFLNQFTELPYHNLKHTESVVSNAGEIAINENLTDNETTILKIAAWFHDVGYLTDTKHHEDKSIIIAGEYLKTNCYSSSFISAVVSCIEATKFPQNPQNKIAACLCDADLYHVSMPDFFDISLNLKKEFQFLSVFKLNRWEYWNVTLNFLEQHQFKTVYGKSKLNELKSLNIKKLKINMAHILKVIKLRKRRIIKIKS